jgi:hypothetical protein
MSGGAGRRQTPFEDGLRAIFHLPHSPRRQPRMAPAELREALYLVRACWFDILVIIALKEHQAVTARAVVSPGGYYFRCSLSSLSG